MDEADRKAYEAEKSVSDFLTCPQDEMIAEIFFEAALEYARGKKTEVSPSREELDVWLTANCGNGIPYGDATDIKSMLHGLAYVLHQIEGSKTYRPHIGQTNSATSALRMALDHFARQELSQSVIDEV